MCQYFDRKRRANNEIWYCSSRRRWRWQEKKTKKKTIPSLSITIMEKNQWKSNQDEKKRQENQMAVGRKKTKYLYVYRRSKDRKNFFFSRKKMLRFFRSFLYYHHHLILFFVLALSHAFHLRLYSINGIERECESATKSNNEKGASLISLYWMCLCALRSCCENIDCAADTSRWRHCRTERWVLLHSAHSKLQWEWPQAIRKNRSNQFENIFTMKTKKKLFSLFFFFGFVLFRGFFCVSPFLHWLRTFWIENHLSSIEWNDIEMKCCINYATGN